MRLIILYFAILTTQIGLCQSSVLVDINEFGIIDVQIKLIKTDSSVANYFFIPLKWNENSQINTAGDIIISPITKNNKFTIFSIVTSSNKKTIDFNISDFGKLSETNEDKYQILLSNFHPYLSDNEKELFTQSYTIIDYELKVKLPKKYEETSINYKNLSSSDKEYFSCNSSLFYNKTESAWLVFPNSKGGEMKISLLIFTFLFSCLLLLIYVPVLKERNIKWSIIILTASLILLFLAYYYSKQYPKGIEFVLGISGTLPHVGYGVVSSIYFLFAKYFSIKIFGKISLDGSETKLVEITVYKFEDNVFKPIKKKTEVKSNGNYSFSIWTLNANSFDYKLSTTHRIADDYSSTPFSLKRGEQHEELINLSTAINYG